jgi:hypothetical protein
LAPSSQLPAPSYLDLRLELDFRRELLRRLRLPGGGTLAPFFRASDKPIAIACCRLFTLPPRPDLPLRKVPFLRRRIALSTLLLAPLLYLLPLDFRDERFLVGIRPLRKRDVRKLRAAGHAVHTESHPAVGDSPLRGGTPESSAKQSP